MTTFVSADHHFGHRNIIRYCARPFESVEEMYTEMARRWNAVVSPDDLVVHLGDFALASRARIEELVESLNGSKVLVLGNHDRSKTAMLACGFDEAVKGEYVLDGIRCVHDPKDARPGKTTLCGHVHDLWRHLDHEDGTRLVNVGVDVRNFAPVRFEAIIEAAPEASRTVS